MQKTAPIRVTPREIINSVKQVVDIDFKDVVTAYKERKITAVPNYRYYPYALIILSMKRLNIQHRIIADWLNTQIVSPHGLMTADKLTELVGKWKKLGLLHNLTDDVLEEYAQKITMMANGVMDIPPVGTAIELDIKEENNIPVSINNVNKFVSVSPDEQANESINEIFSDENQFDLLDFLKSVEKSVAKNLTQEEKENVKKLYNNRDKSISLSGLVESFKEKSGWKKYD